MSNPRYDWWGFAKGMTRRYPDKCLPNEKEAVEAAIEVTQELKDGAERLRLIDMVFWKQSHSLEGAATALYISKRTADRWHGAFLRAVGRHFRCNTLIPEELADFKLPPIHKKTIKEPILTNKQKQVIVQMADCGMKVCAVAKRTGLSQSNVHSSIKQIKQKTGLDCKNFWDLLALNEAVRDMEPAKEDTDG